MHSRPKVSYATVTQEPFSSSTIISSLELRSKNFEVIMGRCCKALGRECSIRNLGTGFHDSRAFTDSPLPRPLFAVLRFVYAALAIGDLVWIGLDHPRGEWIIHFGNWSRVVTALYFLLGSITAFHRSCCGSKESDHYYSLTQDGSNEGCTFLEPEESNSCAVKPGERDDSVAAKTNRLSWHHEVLWILHTLASNSTFVCLIAYYTFFFEVRYSFIGILDFPRHVLYLILLIFDTLASHIPVRLWHVMYAYILGTCYVVFTVVFILTEIKIDLRLDPVVYPSLEFGEHPLIYTAYLSIFFIAGFPVAQVFFFLFYKYRAHLASS